MKIQCPCGSKYSIDVTPGMQSVQFVCPNCGGDYSAMVNELIQRELAERFPSSAPPAAPSPPVAVSPGLRISQPQVPGRRAAGGPSRGGLRQTQRAGHGNVFQSARSPSAPSAWTFSVIFVRRFARARPRCKKWTCGRTPGVPPRANSACGANWAGRSASLSCWWWRDWARGFGMPGWLRCRTSISPSSSISFPTRAVRMSVATKLSFSTAARWRVMI